MARVRFNDNVPDGTAANAWLHAVFACVQATQFGYSAAISWGDAHEARPGNMPWDQAMDETNNRAGAGEIRPYLTPDQPISLETGTAACRSVGDRLLATRGALVFYVPFGNYGTYWPGGFPQPPVLDGGGGGGGPGDPPPDMTNVPLTTRR
jgi:hypothetical protein